MGLLSAIVWKPAKANVPEVFTFCGTPGFSGSVLP